MGKGINHKVHQEGAKCTEWENGATTKSTKKAQSTRNGKRDQPQSPPRRHKVHRVGKGSFVHGLHRFALINTCFFLFVNIRVIRERYSLFVFFVFFVVRLPNSPTPCLCVKFYFHALQSTFLVVFQAKKAYFLHN